MLYLLSKSATKNYVLNDLDNHFLQLAADITSFYPKLMRWPCVNI
jgi:acyl carrier protein phosphodiesterase